jgi:calcineurin-like phosphoesterase family protein
MTQTWIISDSHFGHGGSLRFLRPDGSRLRPFESLEEMDEHMVASWNSVVRPGDRVYHLGDFVIKRAALPVIDRLNGRKVLVRGNHDIFKLKDFLPYFDDIRGSHKLDCFILSHYPIHPDSFGAPWLKANIHGHIHCHQVRLPTGEPDARYFNVSVESPQRKDIGVEEFFPIDFDTIRKYYNQPQEALEDI